MPGSFQCLCGSLFEDEAAPSTLRLSQGNITFTRRVNHNRNPVLFFFSFFFWVCIEPWFSQFFFWGKKKNSKPCVPKHWVHSVDVPELTRTGGCLVLKLLPRIGTGGSLISRETWDRWFFEFRSFSKATPAVL